MRPLGKNQGFTLTSEIILKLVFDTSDIAQSVNLATAPENMETPKNIIATSEVKDNVLFLTVKAEGTLKDLLATIEDYLEKIDLSYKTIEIIK